MTLVDPVNKRNIDIKDNNTNFVTVEYKGFQNDAITKYVDSLKVMNKKGYEPIMQTWIQKIDSVLKFLVSVVYFSAYMFIVSLYYGDLEPERVVSGIHYFIASFGFLYMLLVNHEGILVVTYKKNKKDNECKKHVEDNDSFIYEEDDKS